MITPAENSTPKSSKKQRCGDCGVELTSDNAWPNRHRKKLQSACKLCSRKRADKWRAENHEKELARRRRYYQENKDRVDALQEKIRLRTKYNTTPEEIDSILKSQKGVCAICGRNAATQIDHDHSTGLVRGLLCGNCNTGLGMLRDDAYLLTRAIRYLEEHTVEEAHSF